VSTSGWESELDIVFGFLIQSSADSCVHIFTPVGRDSLFLPFFEGMPNPNPRTIRKELKSFAVRAKNSTRETLKMKPFGLCKKYPDQT